RGNLTRGRRLRDGSSKGLARRGAATGIGIIADPGNPSAGRLCVGHRAEEHASNRNCKNIQHQSDSGHFLPPMKVRLLKLKIALKIIPSHRAWPFRRNREWIFGRSRQGAPRRSLLISPYLNLKFATCTLPSLSTMTN